MFDNEADYLMSLKQEDSYHFTIPFEYIEKNYGEGEYDIATIDMEVDVKWDDEEIGYIISYYAPDFDEVDPSEGNGTIDEFYESWVQEIVLTELDSLGITARALVGGVGTW